MRSLFVIILTTASLFAQSGEPGTRSRLDPAVVRTGDPNETREQERARNDSAGFGGQEMNSFTTLIDAFFEQAFFNHQPTQGTAAGFHQYDTRLENWSKASLQKEAAELKNFAARLQKVPGRTGSQQEIDAQLILSYINARLLELETIREWERNPDNYSVSISNAAFVIMARNYASQEKRLRSLVEREKQMPAVLEDAKKNLKNPPQVYTEVAIMQLPGIVNFFEKDVPLAFKDVKDKKLLAAFGESNGRVVLALRAYQKWLETDLLPRSKGDFRIGAENFRKKLLYEEMVDIPLDRLLEIGMEDLRRNQRSFQEAARKLDASKTPQQILAEIAKNHPAPDKLLQAVRDETLRLKRFIDEHKIVTIPSDVPPIVQETPPFARALTFASMDTPGPFEKVAKEAYYNVTLPEPEWPAKDVEEHMAGFNYGTITSTSVHEAYPGHYTQFLWVPSAPTKTRKLLGANSNSEGWAHYTEQMMLDEGYGGSKDSPEFLKLRLGQLQDALLRNARYIVGVQMHTGKMTFEEGVAFFEKEGYQSHANALRETRRGTSDPTYLYYTLGKLEILKLREDLKKRLGDRFSLQKFHDDFLKQGFPPIKVIRREMLHDDSPAL
jgi:uncharacterized protein (DUF885 family)